MLKGYLKLDEETTSRIWVCPNSNDLHLELQEPELFFFCTKTLTQSEAGRETKAESDR